MLFMHIKLYQQHLWQKCRLEHKINSLSHDLLSKIMVYSTSTYKGRIQEQAKYI